jgi:hypothetical protein
MEGPMAPVIYRAAMAEDPKDSQSADEDWIEELVRRLNEALIAGGRIIAVEFEAMQSAAADTEKAGQTSRTERTIGEKG